MKESILLTGCAGFIGANFLKKIACKPENAKQYDFIVVDALTYAGCYETIKKDIEENEHLSFYHTDIRDQDALNAIFDKHDISGVIHFAAESHVDNSIKNPNIFVETNVLGTLNLLNCSLKAKEGKKSFRYLQVSTDEVYGTLKEDDAAFTENHMISPNSPYSASKAGGDLLVRSYFETFGLDTVTTRCSNNYGAYQFPEKLIPLMIMNANQNKKLPVYGDGRNIRDWIHVDDHSRGVWSAFTKGKPGAVYNLGGNSEKRNIDVVKTILRLTNKPESLITFVEDRKGHDWRYAIDFSKAKQELGWEPQVSFDDGIKATINWYLENSEWLNLISTKR